jgi:hypothetical protein
MEDATQIIDAGTPRGEATPAHKLLATNVAQIVARLRAEYRPRSLVEELYVREIARHAAALETCEAAEPALLRTAASAVGSLAGDVTDVALGDLLLSTAITTEPLDRVARYRRGHERGLHLAIDKLRACQAAASPNGASSAIQLINFTTDEACSEYLRARLTANPPACPECHGDRWHYLASRKQFECGRCKLQLSLRHGTVFAHSGITLPIWFSAIRGYAANSSISIRAMMKLTGLRRRATVRNMLARIRAAHEAGNLACGLAGLNSYPMAEVAA